MEQMIWLIDTYKVDSRQVYVYQDPIDKTVNLVRRARKVNNETPTNSISNRMVPEYPDEFDVFLVLWFYC